MEENALYEIEGMKQQIALLKKKLESQTIVSEQMLDKAIRTNLSKLNRRAWFTGIVGAVAIPYCWYVFFRMNLSTAFCVATAVFLLVCIVATWIQYRGLSAANLIDLTLLPCLYGRLFGFRFAPATLRRCLIQALLLGMALACCGMPYSWAPWAAIPLLLVSIFFSWRFLQRETTLCTKITGFFRKKQ